MEVIIKHENKVIGSVQTNHSMTLEEAMEIAKLDINETNNGDPKYDLDAITMEMVMEMVAEKTKAEIENAAISMAYEIISNGRIEDLEDWEEMKHEMLHEMQEVSVPAFEQEIMLITVKDYWY